MNLQSTSEADVFVQHVGRLWPSRDDFRVSWGAGLRGTGIGSVLGILPGGGALLASFAAYALEKKVARDPSRFGQGAIDGVLQMKDVRERRAAQGIDPIGTTPEELATIMKAEGKKWGTLIRATGIKAD